MSSRKFWLRGFFSLTLLMSSFEAALARPALFSDLSLADAKAKAQKENKLLLVDFGAAWCPPCGEMDKTTWEDPKVVQWLKEKVVAIQIDIDKEPKISQDLRIASIPAIVVFKDKNAELDRQVGMQSSEELLKWLDSLQNGVTSADKLQQSLQLKENRGGPKELEMRSELAVSQLQSHKYEEALENYVWLWQNMLKIDPSMIGVRGSFFADELKDLVTKYPPARVRFAKIRDESELKNVDDWLLLNNVLGNQKLSLQWFNKVKDDSTQLAKLQSVEPELEELLISAGRYSDLAPLIKDPIGQLRELHDDEQKIAQPQLDLLSKEAGTLYAIFMAAGKTEDAEKIAVEALKLDDSVEMRKALIFTALDAGVTSSPVLKRLDELNAANTEDFETAYKLGAAFLKLKKYDAAVKNFSRAIELNPSEALAFDARITAYCELKQYEKAIADANRLLEIYPKSDRSYISRGFIFLKQKKNDLALKEFEQAEKINPRNPLIYIDQSAAYMNAGKFKESVSASTKTIELDQTNAAGYCNRGEAYFKLQNYSSALADLNKSIELGATTCGGENYYYRSQVYKAMNKSDEAAIDLTASQKLGYAPDLIP